MGVLGVYRHLQSRSRGWRRSRRAQRELAQRSGRRAAISDFGQALRLLQASYDVQSGSHSLLPGGVKLAHAPTPRALEMRG